MRIRQLTVGNEKVFCYILSCEETGEAVVVDPGGDVEAILAALTADGLALRYIVNTHGHPDHTGGNARLKEATGAAIVMHEADWALLQDPETGPYFARWGLPASPRPDILAKHGDTLAFGRQTLRILHVPGHTPGGICLLGAGNLFTGDSLFVGAAGRVDLPGGDFATLIGSLEKEVASLPEETVIRPGHDYGDTPTSTVGREKRENPFLGGEW